MPIAYKAKAKWDYVLESERKLPKESQTIFHLQTLDQAGYLACFFPPDNVPWVTVALINGLVGWENFKDELGQPIPFERDANGQGELRNLDRIVPWMFEIGSAIRKREAITKEEEKN